jgi:hypothetical protein
MKMIERLTDKQLIDILNQTEDRRLETLVLAETCDDDHKFEASYQLWRQADAYKEEIEKLKAELLRRGIIA